MILGSRFDPRTHPRAWMIAGGVLSLILGGLLFLHSFASLLPLHTDITKYKNNDLLAPQHPSRQIMALAMQIEKRENFAPSTAARLYAYAASIYADALAQTGSATSSAASAALLLEYVTPGDTDFIEATFAEAYGTTPALAASAGQLLTAYKTRARSDRFNLEWSPSMIPSGDYWYVRDGKIDGGAMSGKWTPWILATSTASVPPPPAHGSLNDALELAKVQYAVNNRRADNLPSIYFWQGSSGFTKGSNHDNITPAGVWQNILSVEEGASLNDAEYAVAQKILAQSIADSFIYTWQVKYTYYTQRPSMRITELNLAIGDPPFPSYISGHSTISATAAVVLSALFPSKQAVWVDNYHDARYSRLDAGIHYDVDNAAGYRYGAQIGDEIVSTLGLARVLPRATPYEPTGIISGLFQLATLSIANYIDSLHLPMLMRSIPSFFAHLFARGPSGGASKITFTDVAATAGLDYIQATSSDPMRCLASSPRKPTGNCELNHMAGGVTVGDYNKDGWPDIFVTRIYAPGILYENMHDGTFKDMTADSGVDTAGFNTNGALFADLDNNGWPDLYVTTIDAKRNLLFMNYGGHFSQEGLARGAALDNGTVHTGQSVSAGDYDRDGYLDLFVDEWRPIDIADSSSTHSVLLHNRGSTGPGFFVDATNAAGIDVKKISDFGVYTISSTFADLDSDGWPDLAITGDFGTSQLYWNNGDGTFTKGTKSAGVDTEENGMGSAIGDYNGDGLLDWFVTSIYNSDPPCKGTLPDCPVGYSGNRLYENTGHRTFSDVTDKAGVRDGGWGWGASWIDADNSGKLDLVMASGFKFGPDDPPIVKTMKSFETSSPMRFWYNNGDGSTSEIAKRAGLTDTNRTTGLATLDFNNDGRTDIVIVDNGGKPHLYRNDSRTRNSWLKVQVLTARGGRDALGAVIKLQTVASSTEQTRQVGVNSGFLGQSEATETFGLGAGTAPVARVTVEWPWLNKTKTYTNIARDTTLVATPD